ncbi:family 43 glycosylhydrolase [Asticcacaulis sp.]|uniref:glycoside hydrolase family 43 protein n=1 Tax=Asticcacaulis sp. TaxID=1872648 RepID=UPI003919175D
MPKPTSLSRRLFIGSAVAAGLSAPVIAQAKDPPIVNPIIAQRADPQILKHSDGYYYFMATVPEYDRLVIRRAKTLGGLSAADEVVVWRRPTEGRMGGYIWAPELHHFDGQWRLYFGAGDKGEPFRVRTYVISTAEANPLTAKWNAPVQVQMPWDTFNLDATVFEHRGVRYMLWAQKEPGIDTNSNLYLAPMATATTFAATPVRLTIPTYDWETVKYKVAEGPAVLIRNGRIFVTYSASATDHNYCLGLLTARADADLMDPASWSKSPVPVFVSSEKNTIWGPGHNGFTVDERGRDVIVYHARDYKEIKGNSLFDPDRHSRLQYVKWRKDGTPDFGEPVPVGPLKR